MKHRLALVLLFACIDATAFAEQDHSPVGVSVGIDLVGLSYNQLLIYAEMPVKEGLRANVAVGYSPAGAWQNGFRYWYLQTEMRNYLAPNGFYSGFGFALYLSPTLLEFSNWNPEPVGKSSVVFGAYGLAGYKFRMDPNSGFYLDPNLFLYALTPMAISADRSEKATFFYKSLSLMGNLIAGWDF